MCSMLVFSILYAFQSYKRFYPNPGVLWWHFQSCMCSNIICDSIMIQVCYIGIYNILCASILILVFCIGISNLIHDCVGYLLHIHDCVGWYFAYSWLCSMMFYRSMITLDDLLQIHDCVGWSFTDWCLHWISFTCPWLCWMIFYRSMIALDDLL